MTLTEGTAADCTQAPFLTADLEAQYLRADRGYDTNAIVAGAMEQGMEPVIPPGSHRKEPRYYDRDLYRLRHLVENAFLDFKQWRGVATRYAKKSRFVPRHLPDPSPCPLVQVILTTLPNTTVADNG